jgi:hypothetical protein
MSTAAAMSTPYHLTSTPKIEKAIGFGSIPNISLLYTEPPRRRSPKPYHKLISSMPIILSLVI